MVDILLATYNGEKYIREQIDSILNQTYQDFRILIRDDGSKDETVSIIENYTKKYQGKIVLIQDNIECGSSVSNFMELSKHATADYIMYCDQDDYWLPNKIESSLNAIRKLEEKIGRDKPILVFARYKVVDENLKEIKNIDKSNQIYKSNTNLSNLIVQNCVTGCLTIVNKRLNDMMGNYDKTILMHDWWAALIASSMGKIVNISDVVMYYRQHGNNVVGSVDVKSFKYRIDKLFDKNTKKAKFLYRDQMILFLNRYEKSLGDNYLVVKRFIDLFNKNKIYRMYILLKFNYLKSDIVRVIGQLLYI